MKYKLSQEVATNTLDTLIDYYEIDVDEMPEELQDALKTSLSKIIKSIRLGRLEVKEENGLKVKQHLKNPPGEITFIEYNEISGKAKTQMKDKHTQYEKIYALMGSLSGLGTEAIKSLKGADLSLAECLGLVFLQV